MPQRTVSNVIWRESPITMEKNTDGRGRRTSYENESGALLKIVTLNRFKPMHIIISTYNVFATGKLISRSIRNYVKKYEL